MASARETISAPIAAHLKREQTLLEEWPGQGRVHVTLAASTAAAITYSARGVTFHLPDCSRFISRVRSFVDREAGLHVRGRSVVLDASSDRDAYRLEFYADLGGEDAVRVDGASVEPSADGEHGFTSSLRITGDRWSLDHDGAGRVRFRADTLFIELAGSHGKPAPDDL